MNDPVVTGLHKLKTIENVKIFLSNAIATYLSLAI